jgi:glucokinase
VKPASVLALDLGGTQLRTALTLADGSVLARHASRTPRTADDIAATCITQLRASRDAALAKGAPEPVAIGISAPGPLEASSGTLLDPPNMDRSLWGFPLGPRISEQLGLPYAMGLDVHVAALGEGDYGAAVGLTDYIYLTVSTGVGGGVVTGRRLMLGADGLAGELGHLMIDIDGPPCGCGARGHLEALSSGTGIARSAREEGLGDVDARQVAALEEQGNAAAALIMERARRSFAEAVVTMVDVFNPQRIVVGGSIAAGQGDRLLGPARDAVADHAYRRQAQRAEIVPTALGDDVGLIGAISVVEWSSRWSNLPR